MSAIVRLTVSLRGVRPSIWRRLELPASLTFAELSAIILTAFGWTGCHSHDFALADRRIGVPLRGAQGEMAVNSDGLADLLGQLARELGGLVPTPRLDDETHVTLARAIDRGERRFCYRYDFGDDWRHLVDVEEVLMAKPGVAYPRCTAGSRAAPPEDCGGAAAYRYLCHVLADPRHYEYPRLQAWCPDFAPERFDLAGTDHAVRAFPNRRHKLTLAELLSATVRRPSRMSGSSPVLAWAGIGWHATVGGEIG